MSKELAFERQNLPDGTPNPKYVDLLDEDKPVAGQKFACISFVSPDNILKKKELFYFEEFLKHWDYTKGVQKFTAFLNFLSCLNHHNSSKSLIFIFLLLKLFEIAFFKNLIEKLISPAEARQKS